MRRDWWIVAALWLAVTAAAIAVAHFLIREITFPTRGAEEAAVIDHAFMVLTYLAAPVFGVVIAALAYNLLRHRSRGAPAEDGPAMYGHGAVPRIWLAATTALTAVLIVYPGLWGLFELRSHDRADLEVKVTGMMWQWVVEYPGAGVRISGAQELVLPADGRHVRFDVTSLDVLHSFWIPAFRVKIDAVPGQTNVVYATPDRTGEPGDAAYRLQCAELCGLFHSGMVMPVRALDGAAFDAWLAQQRQPPAGGR